MKMKLLTLVIAAILIFLGSLNGCGGTPVVEVSETIGVSDSPQITTAVLINVGETIGVNDSPEVLAAVMASVTEPITVTDSVSILLPVEIRVTETIRVVDTNVVQPKRDLPVINYFTANPTRIFKGGSATLNWGVTGATTIMIDNNIGKVAAQGSITVSPTQTTTYTLTASNAGGSVTASVTITVTILRVI
jgi:hypothetical protein